MAKRKRIDPEIPPTTKADWIGAAKLGVDQATLPTIPEPMTFNVFKASSDPSLFAVTATDDPGELPPCPHEGEWTHFKRIKETGQSRVGFSEAEAKADIAKKGYHLVSVEVRTTRVAEAST